MSQQQPYNPANFTNQLGQKAAEFTAAQLERMGMGGNGFIGGAQNRLIGQQVGTYITNEVNEIFHIQNAQGTGQAKPQSGVRNFISNEVGQIFHGKKDEVEGAPQNPQNTEGFMEGAADFVMYQAKQVFHSRGGKDGQPTEVQTVTQVTKTVTTDSGHPGSHMPIGYQQQVTQIEHHYEPSHEPVNNGGGPGSHIPSGAQTGPRDNVPQQQNYGGYQGQQQQNYGGYQGQQQQNYGGYQGQQQKNYGGGYQGQQQQNYGGYQGQPYEGNQQRAGEDDEEDGFFEKTTNKVKGFFNKD